MSLWVVSLKKLKDFFSHSFTSRKHLEVSNPFEIEFYMGKVTVTYSSVILTHSVLSFLIIKSSLSKACIFNQTNHNVIETCTNKFSLALGKTHIKKVDTYKFCQLELNQTSLHT